MNSWTQIRQTLSVQNIHVPFSVRNPQRSLRLNKDSITRKLTNTGTGKKGIREESAKTGKNLNTCILLMPGLFI